MTIASLFTQCCLNLSQKPAEMDLDHQMHLVRSVNEGYGEFIDKLPDIRRRKPRNVLLNPSFTRTVTVTQGQQAITFSPTWAGQTQYFGSSVRVGGLPSYNKLDSLNTLWAAYDGPSGTVSMEIWNDAVLMGVNNHEAVQGEVTLAWDGQSSLLTYGTPPWMAPTSTMPFLRANPYFPMDGVMTLVAGPPTNWWMEPLNGLSAGGAPQMVLRVWPQPDRVYHLSFSEKLWPDFLTVADLASTTELPVMPREEALLVNLCQAGMTSSNLWLGSANKDDAMTAFARSSANLDKQSNGKPNSQSNLCRTKRFF